MSDSIADLEADIERTREQLGETIDALGHKLDVKEHARATAAGHWREAAVVAVTTVLVVLAWKRL